MDKIINREAMANPEILGWYASLVAGRYRR
jgi:hypothetical protein